MKQGIFSLLFLLNVVCAYGQDRLDSLLSVSFMSGSPGCAVLVAKGGKVIYDKAFGSANLELNVPMRSDMVFQLASITKQFTAVAILQLVEHGKLSLQDQLQRFVPDFPAGITIEHLLTHTAGIRDYMQIDYAGQFMERWDFSPKQLIDSFKHYPLEFEPGTKYAYSNSGYYLLGYIIEKVTGMRYQSYVEGNILKPLGLNNTGFDSADVIIPNRVNGYRKEGNVIKNAEYWSPTISYAAGGLLSNTGDLFKWWQGLLSGKVIKKETLEKAFMPYQLKDGTVVSYGYGWYVQQQNGVKSIEHGGKMNGFITHEVYYPKEDVFVVALFNNEDAPKDEIMDGIAGIVLGKVLRANVRIDQQVLDGYVGTYALSTNTKRTIAVVKEEGKLFLKISGQAPLELVFQSAGKFELKNLKGMKGEFVGDNKLMVEQNGVFEWRKIK